MPDSTLSLLSAAISFMIWCAWGLVFGHWRGGWSGKHAPPHFQGMLAKGVWDLGQQLCCLGALVRKSKRSWTEGCSSQIFKRWHVNVCQELGGGEAVWRRDSALSEDVVCCGGREVLPQMSWSVVFFRQLRERTNVHLFLNKHELRLTLGPPRNNWEMIKDLGV